MLFELAVQSWPDDPELRSAWVKAALVGTLAVTAPRKAEFVATIVLSAWQAGGLKSGHLPSVLAATADCDPSVSRADVVDELVGLLVQRLGSKGDPGHRAGYILGLFADGTDADRDAAMKRLLR